MFNRHDHRHPALKKAPPTARWPVVMNARVQYAQERTVRSNKKIRVMLMVQGLALLCSLFVSPVLHWIPLRSLRRRMGRSSL